MRAHLPPGPKAVLATLLALVTLASCSSTMRGDGAGMMGGPSGHRPTVTCTAPASLPGQRVTVMLADMGMSQMMGGDAPLGAHMMLRAFPARVGAGEVTFVAVNRGWRTHELVLMPLGAGERAGQRVPGSDGQVDETGSLGEASASCAAGKGEGITVGTTGWLTLTLPPGRYELMCNLRNHYANGMYQLLVVATGSA